LSEGLGLNLAGADLAGTDFEALPSATYHCSVVKLEMKKTKGGPDATLPKGTPMINVQVKVVQETVEDAEGNEVKCKNRRFFRTLIIAPAKINGKPYEHKKTMDRILGQFFKCVGFSEEEILSGDFNPDFDEIKGRDILVTVGQKVKYGTDPEDEIMDNEVKGFRPYGGDSQASSDLV
jgi:hypothetical protein